MFIYRSRFLTRGEVWFDETPDGERVDWIYHRQRSSQLSKCQCKPFCTPLVDLRKSPDELFAKIDQKTAHKITEAHSKDRLQCERSTATDSSALNRVEQMWNEFAAAQKTPRFERDWIDPIAKAGSLELTAAKASNGDVLAYQLVFLTPKRARLLIGISPHRAVPNVAWRCAVNRANCFLQWTNFLAFQQQGIPFFDFGGWYLGKTNIQFLGINQYKKSFGGTLVTEYDCEQPVTAKGWVLLKTAQLWGRARQVLSSRTENLDEGRLSPTTATRDTVVSQKKGIYDPTPLKEGQVPASFR